MSADGDVQAVRQRRGRARVRHGDPAGHSRVPAPAAALTAVVGELEAKVGAAAIGQIQSALSEHGQQQRFAALFAQIFGLVPEGLGSAHAHGLDDAFVSAIAGNHGLMRRYGAALDTLVGRNQTSNHQLMKLRIFEVSFCQHDEDCGPGGR